MKLLCWLTGHKPGKWEHLQAIRQYWDGDPTGVTHHFVATCQHCGGLLHKKVRAK